VGSFAAGRQLTPPLQFLSQRLDLAGDHFHCIGARGEAKRRVLLGGEYRRLFGNPPGRDIARLKQAPAAAGA
jgi:hypothetical protein